MSTLKHHRHEHRHKRRHEDEESSSRNVSDSSESYDDDSGSETEETDWCSSCRKLIQGPTYQSHAHFHTSRFDMWICNTCFPVPQNEPNVCKCVLNCAICGTDKLYNDKCIPFTNTSRGFCDTCSSALKSVVMGINDKRK